MQQYLRDKDVDYIKGKKNKGSVKLFHNCSYSFWLASSKSGIRKETCKGKNTQIINIFTKYSQTLITQTRSCPSQGMTCTKSLFIISQFQADNGGSLCHSAFLHLQWGEINAQVTPKPSLSKQKDTKAHFLPCICNLVHQPSIFLRDQSPRVKPALKNLEKAQNKEICTELHITIKSNTGFFPAPLRMISKLYLSSSLLNKLTLKYK